MLLDAKQQQMLTRAAALLPLAQRDDFQRSVANVLAGVEHAPRDCDLRDVLRHVLAARGVSIGELLPPHERNYVHDRSANAWQSWHKRTALLGRGELPTVGKSRRSPQRPQEVSE